MSLLEAVDIVAGYGDMEILHGVSLRVEPGEIVAIIGPNGAGKSTLLKAVFGLLPLKAGRVVLDGEDITGLPPHARVRRGMGYVPQADNVFPSLTVKENLEMGAFIAQDGVAERLREVYGLFPVLWRKRHEKASRLSGGERQMLALARGLMVEPRVLLLDEPSAGLAPVVREGVFESIRAINETGVSLVIVEQNAKQVLSLSHRGYVLAMGQNRLEGTGPALLQNEEVGRLYLGVEVGGP